MEKIRYGSCFGLLEYVSPEDYAKDYYLSFVSFWYSEELDRMVAIIRNSDMPNRARFNLLGLFYTTI